MGDRKVRKGVLGEDSDVESEGLVFELSSEAKRSSSRSVTESDSSGLCSTWSGSDLNRSILFLAASIHRLYVPTAGSIASFASKDEVFVNAEAFPIQSENSSFFFSFHLPLLTGRFRAVLACSDSVLVLVSLVSTSPDGGGRKVSGLTCDDGWVG